MTPTEKENSMAQPPVKNKKIDTIETLKAELLKANRKRIYIQNKIEDKELAEIFPDKVKQFKEKFFKYDNGISADERWPMYIYVKDVVYQCGYRGYEIKGFSFQTDYKGEVSFNVSELTYSIDSTTEITKAEFTKALKKAQDRISKITII